MRPFHNVAFNTLDGIDGAFVMLPTAWATAVATVTLHGEYGHGAAPLVAAALSNS